MRCVIETRLLGQPELSVNGHVMTLSRCRQRLPRELLQFLLLQPGFRALRQTVLGHFWPRASTLAANNRLDHTVHLLRKMLREQFPTHTLLSNFDRWLVFGQGHEIRSDVHQFLEFVANARAVPEASEAALASAEALYSGDLLEGTPLDDSLLEMREHLRWELCWAIGALASHDRAHGRLQLAMGRTQRLLDIDPGNEAAHLSLMELYEATGAPERAVSQFATCRRELQREHNAEPAPSTRAVLDRLLARPSLGLSNSAQPRAKTVRDRSETYRAPVFAVPVLGFESALAGLACDMFELGKRFITLWGPAGSGKTRLAQSFLEASRLRFTDGVVEVSMSAARSTSQALGMLEQALGCLEPGEAGDATTRVEALAQLLAQADTLVVLDGVESVVSIAPYLEKLLQHAPRLRLLLTSQRPLRTASEHLRQLPALIDEALESGVQLFVQNTHARGGTIELNSSSRPEIELLCSLLDGNPRLIEIAAARAVEKHLSELLAGVVRPLDLMVGTECDVPESLRTARAMIARSVSFLDGSSQACLHAVALMGEFVAEAEAEALLTHFWPRALVRRTLSMLVEFQLLRRTPNHASGWGRNALSTTCAVRQYALEALHWPGGEGRLLLAYSRLYSLHSLALAPRDQQAAAAAKTRAAAVEAALEWNGLDLLRRRHAARVSSRLR
jgi:DNA-binding SARP family transcriptional activator/predicted ATPase